MALSTLAIVSDVHYAGPSERSRGNDYEFASIPKAWLRFLVRCHRQYVWLRNPLEQNYLLDAFLLQAAGADYAIANGDYSCNVSALGVSDPAAAESVRLCLERLRSRFGPNLRITMGDHELGKVSLCGDKGGMRLESWHQAVALGVQPFWRLDLGCYTLLGLASSLVALPVFEADTLPEERPAWEKLRQEHLTQVRAVFASLETNRRVLLFVHDPTALPFLWREPAVRSKLPQVEQTVIGHLHSTVVLRKAQWLAGMPRLRFLGHTARRLSRGLQEARYWREFNVRLCPSLAGLEALHDGGYYFVQLDPDGQEPARFYRRRLARNPSLR